MSQFKVLAAEKLRELPPKDTYAAKVVYRLAFEGDAADAEWMTNATTPCPQPGDVLDGEVTAGGGYQGANKFAKSRGNFGGGGGGKSPAERAEIRRENVLRTAAMIAQAQVDAGKAPENATFENWLKPIADRLEKDILDARDAA